MSGGKGGLLIERGVYRREGGRSVERGEVYRRGGFPEKGVILIFTFRNVIGEEYHKRGVPQIEVFLRER